jgi:hypothetical protein
LSRDFVPKPAVLPPRYAAYNRAVSSGSTEALSANPSARGSLYRTASQRLLVALKLAAHAEVSREIEQLDKRHERCIVQIGREVDELASKSARLASRVSLWPALLTARSRANARQMERARCRLLEAEKTYTAERTALLDRLFAAQEESYNAIWRVSTLTLAVFWILQTAAILSGKVAATDEIHMSYYAACALIYPVLAVAGFAEIAVMRSFGLRVGLRWRILSFTIPAVAGEMACLRALAYERSTSLLLHTSLTSLALTMTTLIGIVIFGRASILHGD